MRLVVLGVLLFAFACVGDADASVRLMLPDGTTPRPEQRWVNRAKVPTPDVTVQFHFGGCPGYEFTSCTFDTQPDPTVWIPLEKGFAGGVDYEGFMHEMGFVYDAEMPTRVRWKFEAIMHMPATPWYGTGPGDFAQPAESFADAWRLCAQNPHKAGYDRLAPYHPTHYQYRKVCVLIQRGLGDGDGGDA
jgi:hypothetical protein